MIKRIKAILNNGITFIEIKRQTETIVILSRSLCCPVNQPIAQITKMRVVQTFWTGKRENPALESYGWSRPEYHMMSWVLSASLLRKHYDNLTLYTDEAGYDLLINQLGLPYTDVKVELDSLNPYHADLWALSKIYTYSRQNEPFLHVDGDVFTWRPFPAELMTSPLIAQNLENGGEYYADILRGLHQNLSYFPEAIRSHKGKSVLSYNAGIIGGCDYEFYKRYADEAFDFVNENMSVLDHVHKTTFNIFFEQHLYYCMVSEEGREVNCLFPGCFDDPFYLGYGNFDEVPQQRSYLHLMGRLKKNEQVLYMMESQLRLEFPDVYGQLLDFFEKTEGLEAPSQTDRQLLTAWQSNDELIARSAQDFNLLKRDHESFISLKHFIQHGLHAHKSSRLDINKDLALTQASKADAMANGHSADESVYQVAIPQIGGSTSQQLLDELDFEIVEFLTASPRQIHELLTHIVQFFEGETEREMSLAFQNLISDRLRNLMLGRVIHITRANSFNLNHHSLGKTSSRLSKENRTECTGKVL